MASANFIPMDLFTDEQHITIYLDLPGVKKESITLDLYNNRLIVSCVRVKDYTGGEVNEIRSGNFRRTINLPICVTKKETVHRSLENGVLKIRIDKYIEEGNKFSLNVEDGKDD